MKVLLGNPYSALDGTAQRAKFERTSTPSHGARYSMNDAAEIIHPRPSTGAPLSKAEAVYRTLRQEIVSMALAPGATIDKLALCRRLNVSRFPVSDALSRLAREGLVIVEPQRGSFVAVLNLAEIRSAAFVRCALEVEASRLVAARATPALIEAMKANLDRQEMLAATMDADGFHAEDVAFHELIMSALGLPRAYETNLVAIAQVDRARRATLPSHGRVHEALREHRVIANAFAKQDGDAAAIAMRVHLDQMLMAVETFAQERSELFAS